MNPFHLLSFFGFHEPQFLGSQKSDSYVVILFFRKKRPKKSHCSLSDAHFHRLTMEARNRFVLPLSLQFTISEKKRSHEVRVFNHLCLFSKIHGRISSLLKLSFLTNRNRCPGCTNHKQSPLFTNCLIVEIDTDHCIGAQFYRLLPHIADGQGAGLF